MRVPERTSSDGWNFRTGGIFDRIDRIVLETLGAAISADNVDDGGEPFIHKFQDNADDPEQARLRKEVVDAVRDALNALPNREAEIVYKCMVDGVPYNVMGEKYGISRERVRQIVLETAINLRAKLAKFRPVSRRGDDIDPIKRQYLRLQNNSYAQWRKKNHKRALEQERLRRERMNKIRQEADKAEKTMMED